ncbi:outer membrane protein N [Klebsiella pneumoniae]|nr:outer membrane protein N [Klebsiella pneumoniae]
MPTAIKPMPGPSARNMTPINIYLAAMYAETRNMTFYGNDSFGGIANKTQNFEVVAQY